MFWCPHPLGLDKTGEYTGTNHPDEEKSQIEPSFKTERRAELPKLKRADVLNQVATDHRASSRRGMR
jgi:hypothetical protein